MIYIKSATKFFDNTAFIKVQDGRTILVSWDGRESEMPLAESCVENVAKGTWVLISEQEAKEMLNKKVKSFQAGDVFGKPDHLDKILVADYGYVRRGEEQKYVFLGLFGNAGKSFSNSPMTPQEVLDYLNNHNWRFEKSLTIR